MLKRLIPFLLIPVFYAYGPNLVGYETIFETTLNDENALHDGQTIACNVLTQYGDHRLVEGRLKRVEIFDQQVHFIMVDTPLFKNIPLPLPESDVEFCLAYYVYPKGYLKGK